MVASFILLNVVGTVITRAFLAQLVDCGLTGCLLCRLISALLARHSIIMLLACLPFMPFSVVCGAHPEFAFDAGDHRIIRSIRVALPTWAFRSQAPLPIRVVVDDFMGGQLVISERVSR
jgi:hypothetical protein